MSCIARMKKKYKPTETQQKNKKNSKKKQNITEKTKGLWKSQSVLNTTCRHAIPHILVHVAHIFVALTLGQQLITSTVFLRKLTHVYLILDLVHCK